MKAGTTPITSHYPRSTACCMTDCLWQLHEEDGRFVVLVVVTFGTLYLSNKVPDRSVRDLTTQH